MSSAPVVPEGAARSSPPTRRARSGPERGGAWRERARGGASGARPGGRREGLGAWPKALGPAAAAAGSWESKKPGARGSVGGRRRRRLRGWRRLRCCCCCCLCPCRCCRCWPKGPGGRWETGMRCTGTAPTSSESGAQGAHASRVSERRRPGKSWGNLGWESWETIAGD